MSAAVLALVILVISVVLFVTEWIPSWVTAVIACAAMALAGVGSVDEIFSGFSNSIIVLMVGAMVVGTAMFETGAAQIVGRKVLSLSKGNPIIFLAAICIVPGVMSMFLADTAVVAMFLPIIASVCQSTNGMRNEDFALPLALAALYGGSCTLIGCTPQLTANALLSEMTGLSMGMWTLTPPGLCLFALMVLYVVFIGYRKGRRIWGGRPVSTMDIDEEKINSVKNGDYDKKKVITMLVIVTLMIASYILAILPTAMTALCAALACIVFRCCTPNAALKGINWDVVLFLGGCLGIANGLTTSGAGDLLGAAVQALIGDSVDSPMLVFAILVLLALVISQFITNSTAIIIVQPIAITLCTLYGFDYMAFTVGIMFAACTSFLTPLAASVIAMTKVAGYKFNDYIRYTWPLLVVSYIGILVIVPFFYPLV